MEEQGAFESVRASLACLQAEAAEPGRFGARTRDLVDEFERELRRMFAEEDEEQGEAVSQGVVAQKRVLARERQALLEQLRELRSWFDSGLPDYPSSPVASCVDSLTRGLKRYFEDESEFAQERELTDTPAMD